MHIAELDFDGVAFKILNIEVIDDFEGVTADRREKNWAPFEYNGNLLLTYSISPHRILSPLEGTNFWTLFAETNSRISWYCGELRGGTPALKIMKIAI